MPPRLRSHSVWAVLGRLMPHQPTRKRSGGRTRGGQVAFPIYKDLGVGIHQIQLLWNETAPDRPAHATDPNDPAYRWPDVSISRS